MARPPDWTTAVPARLRDRVAAIMAPYEGSGTAVLLQAAVDVSRDLVQHEEVGRDGALNLLAADALVTHAMECLAEHPDRLDAACRDAMSALSSIVPTGD